MGVAIVNDLDMVEVRPKQLDPRRKHDDHLHYRIGRAGRERIRH